MSQMDDMVTKCVCAYLVSITVGLPLTLAIFFFNFFYLKNQKKDQSGPFLYFYFSNVWSKCYEVLRRDTKC